MSNDSAIILKKMKSSVNSLINAYNNEIENHGERMAALDILEDMTKILRHRNIEMRFGASSPKISPNGKIPNVNGLIYKCDQLQWMDKLIANARKFSAYSRNISVISHYNYANDNTSLHGWIYIDPGKYHEFIKHLNQKPYIYTNHTVDLDEYGNPKPILHTKSNALLAANEDTFVAEIIYADSNILRLRAKSAYYGKYDDPKGGGNRGFEDYTYYRNTTLDIRHMNFIPKRRLSDGRIDKSHRVFSEDRLKIYRRRINYLIRVSEDKTDDYYNSKLVWNQYSFIDH